MRRGDGKVKKVKCVHIHLLETAKSFKFQQQTVKVVYKNEAGKKVMKEIKIRNLGIGKIALFLLIFEICLNLNMW